MWKELFVRPPLMMEPTDKEMWVVAHPYFVCSQGLKVVCCCFSAVLNGMLYCCWASLCWKATSKACVSNRSKQPFGSNGSSVIVGLSPTQPVHLHPSETTLNTPQKKLQHPKISMLAENLQQPINFSAATWLFRLPSSSSTHNFFSSDSSSQLVSAEEEERRIMPQVLSLTFKRHSPWRDPERMRER